MAHKVAVADGAWSAAATWNVVTNTPTLHASTNIAVSGTSYTLGFTAPNLVNACVGVLMHMTTKPTGGTSYTVTLQESTIDTVATVTILNTAFPVANHWVFFKFAVPYVFTTLVASSYRFKIVRDAVTTVGLSLAADSGTANPAFLAVDDRTGVPTTEDVWIVQANCTGTVTVTMDATQTVGSGTDTAVVVRRSIGNGLNIYAGGLLTWDTVADATLTCRGNVAVFGDVTTGSAELRIGTVGVPMPAARTAKLRFNENGVTTSFGCINWPNGKVTLQGIPKSTIALWKTKYVSGTGIAVDPLIVADAVNWVVGDEIIVGASSDNATNYNESENKFVITVVSPTSYIISNTKGGLEAALTYVHTTDAWVLNVERNVIVDSTTITEAFYWQNLSTVSGDVDVDWTRFETVGSSTTGKNGLSVTGITNGVGSVDYSVCYRPLYMGFTFVYPHNTTATFTGLIVCNQNSSSATWAACLNINGTNFYLVDCFAIKNNRYGWIIQGAKNTFLRCYAISCHTGSTVSGITLLSLFNSTFTDCESHCNRYRGLTFDLSCAGLTFNNFLSGTKGTNSIDIRITSSIFVTATFKDSNFGSATFVDNYLAALGGTLISFDNLNGVPNNHVWYTNYGVARSTGAGLADINVRTAGSLAVRLAPEDSATGSTWSFKILAKSSSAVSVFGFIQKNAAFGADVVTVNLYLPGSTTPDATMNMPNDVNWNVFNLAANYIGTVDRYATVEIVARSITAGAYCYVDDLYNGTNKITALDLWDNGMPSPIMFEQLGDAAAVWAVLASTQTTPGTMGELVVDIEAETAAILTDTGTTLPATLATLATASALTTVDGIVDDILTDTGTTLPATLTILATAAALTTVDGIVDDILVDTSTTLPVSIAALPTALTIDSQLSGVHGAGSWEGATAAAIDVQLSGVHGAGSWATATGFATSAALAIVDGVVDDILVDTGTTLPATLAALPTADDFHDETVEGTLTFRQITRIILAALAGKTTGGGTLNPKFRDGADTKNRISATVDSSGNRTAVTLDGS